MRRVGWFWSALFCFLPAALYGQVATGTIVGVVEDATGGVIPNAQVTITHTATADSRQARTNERGEFNIPYVRIGEYSVAVEAQGFKRKVLTGITIRVDQTVSLRADQFAFLFEELSVTVRPVDGASPHI